MGHGDKRMTGLMITVAGASLVAYVLRSANAEHGRRRHSGAGDGASDPSGDGEGFGWFSSSSDSGGSGYCSADGAVATAAAAMEEVVAAAIECHWPDERQNGLQCPTSLDSFQYESRISLELLQKALFPFASGETRQYR